MLIEITRRESQEIRVALDKCARWMAQEARYEIGDARHSQMLGAVAESYRGLSRMFLVAELEEFSARSREGTEADGPSGVTGDNLERTGA